jgi:hypothetical protein
MRASRKDDRVNHGSFNTLFANVVSCQDVMTKFAPVINTSTSLKEIYLSNLTAVKLEKLGPNALQELRKLHDHSIYKRYTESMNAHCIEEIVSY